MLRLIAHGAAVCLLAAPLTAHALPDLGDLGSAFGGRVEGDDKDFEPHWQPSFSAFGSLGGAAELTEGTSAHGAGLGGRLSLDYLWTAELIWANSITAVGTLLPDPALLQATVRTGVRYQPFHWLYAGANLLVDLYPEVQPGLEPVVGVQLTFSNVQLYAQVSTPYRFLDEEDPFDIELEGGIATRF